MIITKHAEQRMRERLGLNKKSMQRMVQKVYNNGKRVDDFKGGMYKYLFNIEKSHKSLHGEDSSIRMYGDFIYLFTGQSLITVFRAKKQKHKKKEVE